MTRWFETKNNCKYYENCIKKSIDHEEKVNVYFRQIGKTNGQRKFTDQDQEDQIG